MTLENNYDIKSLTTPAATGGTVTTTATYRIHTFTSSGTFITNKSMNVEVLVVAGGGGNGTGETGGGGAGGLIYNSSFAVLQHSYPVVVGTGGTGDQKGLDSTFSTLDAIGGGQGGEAGDDNNGRFGGSGGGGSTDNLHYSASGGVGTAGQGYAGGSVSGNRSGGGGGGAGAAGGNGTTNSGAVGGNGLSYSISGTATYYAGGGGGGAYGSGSAGGLGGGGTGGNPSINGTNGTANTGGGAGGDWYYARTGGSGIVIIRYPLSEDMTPANITSTSINATPSIIPCTVGTCTMAIHTTWTNEGGTPGTFVPNITIDTVAITPNPLPSELLAAGVSVSHTFTVSGLTAGTHAICALGTPVPPPALLLSGNYSDGGNIYSPEIDIAKNRMYFGGWYNQSDYPDDAIYVTDLDNLTNVRKIIQVSGQQVNDPSIVDNKMYMTYSPDPSDLTKQYVAVSTTSDNGATWSATTQVVPAAWLPSAILKDNIYVYYTSSLSTQLLRAKLNSDGNAVVETTPVTFDDPYPINVCVKHYDDIYYLLGDYWALVNSVATYCIGMWTSTNGTNFTKYPNNPVVIPYGDYIIARTPYFIKEGNILRIWYGQQKSDWWTNAIYYVEYMLGQ